MISGAMSFEAGLDTSNAKLKLAVSQTEAEAAQLELNSANTTLTNAINAANLAQGAVDTATSLVNNKTNALNTARDQASVIAAQAKAKQTQVTTQVNLVKAAASTLNAANGRLSRANGQFAKANSQLEKANAMSIPSPEYENVLDSLGQVIGQRVSNQSDIDRAQGDKEAAVSSAQTELENANAEKDAATSEVRTAQSTLDTAQTSLETLQTELSDLRRQEEEANVLVATLGQELNDLQTNLTEAQGQLTKAQNDLESAQADVNNALVRVNSSEESKLMAEQELQDAEQRLLEAEAARFAAEQAQIEAEAAQEAAELAEAEAAERQAKEAEDRLLQLQEQEDNLDTLVEVSKIELVTAAVLNGAEITDTTGFNDADGDGRDDEFVASMNDSDLFDSTLTDERQAVVSAVNEKIHFANDTVAVLADSLVAIQAHAEGESLEAQYIIEHQEQISSEDAADAWQEVSPEAATLLAQYINSFNSDDPEAQTLVEILRNNPGAYSYPEAMAILERARGNDYGTISIGPDGFINTQEQRVDLNGVVIQNAVISGYHDPNQPNQPAGVLIQSNGGRVVLDSRYTAVPGETHTDANGNVIYAFEDREGHWIYIANAREITIQTDGETSSTSTFLIRRDGETPHHDYSGGIIEFTEHNMETGQVDRQVVVNPAYLENGFSTSTMTGPVMIETLYDGDGTIASMNQYQLSNLEIGAMGSTLMLLDSESIEESVSMGSTIAFIPSRLADDPYFDDKTNALHEYAQWVEARQIDQTLTGAEAMQLILARAAELSWNDPEQFIKMCNEVLMGALANDPFNGVACYNNSLDLSPVHINDQGILPIYQDGTNVQLSIHFWAFVNAGYTSPDFLARFGNYVHDNDILRLGDGDGESREDYRLSNLGITFGSQLATGEMLPSEFASNFLTLMNDPSLNTASELWMNIIGLQMAKRGPHVEPHS